MLNKIILFSYFKYHYLVLRILFEIISNLIRCLFLSLEYECLIIQVVLISCCSIICLSSLASFDKRIQNEVFRFYLIFKWFWLKNWHVFELNEVIWKEDYHKKLRNNNHRQLGFCKYALTFLQLKQVEYQSIKERQLLIYLILSQTCCFNKSYL
jgi:hypothetical protein